MSLFLFLKSLSWWSSQLVPLPLGSTTATCDRVENQILGSCVLFTALHPSPNHQHHQFDDSFQWTRTRTASQLYLLLFHLGLFPLKVSTPTWFSTEFWWHPAHLWKKPYDWISLQTSSEWWFTSMMNERPWKHLQGPRWAMLSKAFYWRTAGAISLESSGVSVTIFIGLAMKVSQQKPP